MGERGRMREGEGGRNACLSPKIFFYVCLDAFCVLYLAKIYSTILVQMF